MAPPTMKALVTGKRSWFSIIKNGITRRDFGHGSLISDSVPTPKPDPDEILVKVHVVAQNPTDWKHIDFLSPPGAIIGCDFAGEVAELGSAVPPNAWKAGERVAGCSHGGLYKDQGAYAQYLRIPYDLVWKIPASISDREATTYGVSAITSMQALYHNLPIPWPDETKATSSPGTILIYAGSTAAGLYALRMASHAGWTAITTCSPRNFDLVKQYGATEAFDYNSTTLVADMKKAYPTVTAAMDCFSEGASSSICDQVIGSNGGRVIRLLPGGKSKVKGVENKTILAYTLTGRAFQFVAPIGPKYAAVPEDRAALKRFYALLPDLLGWLKPIPIEVVEGGWDGLEKGLDLLRQGKVSGKKLVVELEP